MVKASLYYIFGDLDVMSMEGQLWAECGREGTSLGNRC